jgi:hypothetical protein
MTENRWIREQFGRMAAALIWCVVALAGLYYMALFMVAGH